MSILLAWASVVALALLFRAQHWPFAHALLVLGFSGYSGYALFAMLHIEVLPLPRWSLGIPVILFSALLLVNAGLNKWSQLEWIWLGGFVILAFLVYSTNLVLLRRRR